jgi:hypothetical protein
MIQSRRETARFILVAMLAAVLPLAIAGGVTLPGGQFADLHAQEASWTIEDLAWMAGHWAGDVEELGGRVEEGWFGPADGSMSGVFRLVSAERGRMYELLLLEQEGQDIFYRFKHVSPGYREWEEEPLEYRLIELAEQRAEFESTSADPQPNLPHRIVYQRTTDATLRIVVVGWVAGSDLEFVLTRQ